MLKVNVAEDLAYGTTNSYYGPWLVTSGCTDFFVDRDNRAYHALGFEPQSGDVIQIRFKLEGCVAATDSNPQVVVVYDRTNDGVSDRGSYNLTAEYPLQNGVYQTLTIPVNSEFASSDVITNIGFRFWHIKSQTKGSGKVIIDYIYVGPKENVPAVSYTATFTMEDGTVLYKQSVPAGSTATYAGTTPTKAADTNNHYSFAGWDKALTNITGDTTFIAQFTAVPHSFSYSKVDDTNHKGSCSCGYTFTTAHGWNNGELTSPPDCDTDGIMTYTCSDCKATKTETVASHGHSYTGVTTTPTCTQQGYTTYTCSRCGHSYKDHYTEVAGHAVVVDEAVAATCTATGLTEGKHCEVCGTVLVAQEVIPATGHTEIIHKAVDATCTETGLTEGKHCGVCGTVLVAQEAVPAKGHSYVYSKLHTLAHLVTCKNCDLFVEAPHSYVEGYCVCGEQEIKEPIVANNLKLGHTLNLASDISVNFAVKKTGLDGFDLSTVYVESVLDLYEGNEKIGTTTIRMEPVENGDYYYFTLTGITAIQMNDCITSILHGVKDGQPYCSPADTYSVADYAYSQLSKANTGNSLKTLCADLLRYGTKAQIFKGYRMDALADNRMTEEHKVYLSDMEAIAFGNTNTTLNDLANAPIAWIGKSLNLESKVTLRFVFQPKSYTGDVNVLTAKMTYEDISGETKTITLTHPELYNEEKGYYAFTNDVLLAAELRTVLSIQIYSGNSPVSCTLRYSADTYANNKTGTLLELCKALFAYSDSAKVYFAK